MNICFPKKILIIISSKNPTQILSNTINNLYNIQFINYDPKYFKICIIDSDSNNFDTYKSIKKKYVSIDIHFIKNKNYEYGAYKYGYNLYPDYDIYLCCQDSISIQKYIDLNKVTDLCVYSIYNLSGFNSHLSIKQLAISLLQNTNLDYENIINTNFNLACHNTFICSNSVLKDIFNTLINPPIDKKGSCSYERLFGLYFILKNINTINLNPFVQKTRGLRS